MSARMVRADIDVSLRALWEDETAPTAVEYALMLSGITAVIFASVVAFGQAVAGLFNQVVSRWP